MKSSISKREIARHQINKAIKQFRLSDFICAITLAGAAEEVCGELMRREGTNALEDRILLIQRIEEIQGDSPTNRKDWNERLNFTRNELKHWRTSNRYEVISDWKEEATDLIDRAICNYVALYNEADELMTAFLRTAIDSE